MFTVFAVCDPDSRAPVYVGKTTDLDQRAASLLRQARRHDGRRRDLTHWIGDLLLAGKKPLIIRLEQWLSSAEADGAKAEWTSRFRSQGHKLFIKVNASPAPEAGGFVTYAIRDPCTLAPFFVGQTDDLERSKSEHLAGARPSSKTVPVQTKIYELLAAGIQPQFRQLEKTSSIEDSLASEVRWIARLTLDGHELVNHEHRSTIETVLRYKKSAGRNVA